jgi:hypothetical protein
MLYRRSGWHLGGRRVICHNFYIKTQWRKQETMMVVLRLTLRFAEFRI